MERFLALIILLLSSPLLLILCVLIKIDTKGPILYWSKRFGKNNILFSMPKFRTMIVETPQVATHLLDKPEMYTTKVGRLLRQSSLDELPQLFSIVLGDMRFVGPRPALFNQNDLIDMRTKNNIHTLMPGVTGWAQINGRDELSLEEKVNFEIEYKKRRSLNFDCHIIWLTFVKLFGKDGISH
ncbi:MAG: sugar transferase [Gammaproteobacteria bacterium]